MDALAAGHDAAVQMIDTSVVRVHSTERVSRTTITKLWVAREEASRARSRGGSTPMVCRSISRSRPMKRMTIGCVRFSSARCSHKRCYSRIVDTTRTGSVSLPASKEHGRTFAETKSQRPDLLQPVSVSRAELDRTVLQQNHAMSACRNPI
jgi:hypothetical protein